MPVFVVVLNRRPETVLPRIEEFPAHDRYRIKHDTWLIEYEGTTKALAEKIGIRGSGRDEATGIVFPISNYSGRASADLWEWLKLHQSRDDN